MAKDLSGAQTGMSPSNPVNNPRPTGVRGVNSFPQSYPHFTSERYGEYSPFYWTKAERGDVQNLHTIFDLNTYTFKSPFKGDLIRKSSFVKVPMQAIYPRTWEKQFTIPTQGDDVPSDCRALLDVSSLLNAAINLFNDAEDGTFKVRALFLIEAIASHGSLFEKFNIHFNYVFTFDGFTGSIDRLIDNKLAIELIDFGRDNALLDDNDVFYFVRTTSDDFSNQTTKYVNEHRFFELLRSNEFYFSDGWENFTFQDKISLVSGYDSSSDDMNDPYKRFINIEPIIAYQLTCAQYGTNDFVDYIYSAKLWLENLQSFSVSLQSLPYFVYNGVYTLYDVNSLNVYTNNIRSLIRFSNDPDSCLSCIYFFMNLLSYQNSLRYGDYFNGGKPRPLAVGEYSANVVNGEVSAIDVTRSIQMQRLLNRVNMVGRKLGDYLTGVFGGKLPDAPKDVPIFLAHQNFPILSYETNNTGAAQFDENQPNTITTHLRTSESRHSFEIEIDVPCYLIGLSSYAIKPLYSRTIDRFAFHHDRYDDFIPQMQFIGDQDIMFNELDSSIKSDIPFAYTLRYMEYKQRYGYVSGAFVENLPSWAFVIDNDEGNPPSNSISPSFIRSSSSEFDRFYKSLTGYSLGSYFHFAIAYQNVCSPLRRMEYTPEILG